MKHEGGTLSLWRKDSAPPVATPAPARPILTLRRSAPAQASKPQPAPKAATRAPAPPAAPKPPVLAGAKPWDEWDDERIARRVAALARVQEALPEVFDQDNLKPLPADVNVLLATIDLPKETGRDVIDWWTTRPAYQRMRTEKKLAARLRRSDNGMGEGRIARRVAALDLLSGLAPDVFDIERPKPLAIGIDRELIAFGMEQEAIGDALRWWTKRPGYFRALAAGGPRYALDGSEAGVVSDEDSSSAGKRKG
jgi:ProP effector